MFRILLLIALFPAPLLAQITVQESVRDYRRANEHRIIKEFLDLLSIPNVASDQENIRKNSALIVQMMKQRGLNPRLLEAKSPTHLPLSTANGTPPAQNALWCSTLTTTVNQLIQNNGLEANPGDLFCVRLRWKQAGRPSLSL